MPISPRKEKITRLVNNRQSGLIVVFEDIHDPHNAAAVLRSCDALGIQEAYFIFETEKPYNPARVGKSSSSSANKWLTITTYRSTRTCLAALKKKGYTIIATALTDTARDLLRKKFNEKKIALLVGNEHRGLSATALALADQTVMIPMRGMVQSLNLSVTTALCLWEITRQREKSRQRYHLSPKERQRLIRRLVKK